MVGQPRRHRRAPLATAPLIILEGERPHRPAEVVARQAQEGDRLVVTPVLRVPILSCGPAARCGAGPSRSARSTNAVLIARLTFDISNSAAGGWPRSRAAAGSSPTDAPPRRSGTTSKGWWAYRSRGVFGCAGRGGAGGRRPRAGAWRTLVARTSNGGRRAPRRGRRGGCSDGLDGPAEGQGDRRGGLAAGTARRIWQRRSVNASPERRPRWTLRCPLELK